MEKKSFFQTGPVMHNSASDNRLAVLSWEFGGLFCQAYLRVKIDTFRNSWKRRQRSNGFAGSCATLLEPIVVHTLVLCWQLLDYTITLNSAFGRTVFPSSAGQWGEQYQNVNSQRAWRPSKLSAFNSYTKPTGSEEILIHKKHKRENLRNQVLSHPPKPLSPTAGAVLFMSFSFVFFSFFLPFFLSCFFFKRFFKFKNKT